MTTRSKACGLTALAVLCALALFPHSSRAAEPLPGRSTSVGATNDEVWIFAFYRHPGATGIYLASSEDGLHFTPLNNDAPVMPPPQWPDKQNLTRDPSVIYHDGKFRVVWTSFHRGRCLGYAESPDLVHWSEPVKVKPFPEALPPEQQPKNIWSSQICWDPAQQNYMINTSSRIGTNGQRIFLTRTPDGKTFGNAQPLLDPGFDCIEGMMALEPQAAGGRWVMFFKNEAPATNGGKNLRFATAPMDFSQPLAVHPTPVAGTGTKLRSESMSEGPCLVKTKTGWNLYWDIPLIDSYGAASSTDLTNWVDHTAELQLPAHCRHGSVFLAPRSAVGWLQKPAAADKP